MLKTLMAKTIALALAAECSNDQADTLTKTALNGMTETVGGDGGAIAVKPDGTVAIAYNSARMAWAYGQQGTLHSGCNPGEHFQEKI